MKQIVCVLFLIFMPLASNAAINPDVVRENIISNTRAAIAAVKSEQEKFAELSLLSLVTAFMPDMFTLMLSQMTETEHTPDSLLTLLAALFNKDLIMRSTETTLSYHLDSSLCEHLTDSVGASVCQGLMSAYMLMLEVTSVNNADYEMTLSAQQKNANTAPCVLITSSSHTNSTRKTINLDGLFEVFTHVAKSNSETGELIKSSLSSLTGKLSFGFNFKTPNLDSGCANNAPACFFFNVDSELSFSAQKDNLVLKGWSSSKSKTPTFYALFNQDQVEVRINSGRFNFISKEPKAHLSIGRLQTTFVIQPTKDKNIEHTDPVVIVKNFSLEEGVNNASFDTCQIGLDFKFNQANNDNATMIHHNKKGGTFTINAFTMVLKALKKQKNSLAEELTFSSSVPSILRINQKSSSAVHYDFSSAFLFAQIAQVLGVTHDQGFLVCDQGDFTMKYENSVQSENEDPLQLQEKQLTIDEKQSLLW